VDAFPPSPSSSCTGAGGGQASLSLAKSSPHLETRMCNSQCSHPLPSA
jgi:hypothetical protein